MAIIEGYNMPDDLYYEAEHAWARIEDDRTVTVGMDEFYVKNAGDILSVDLPKEGDEFLQGETCGKIYSAKWIGKIQAPIGGKVIEINKELEDDASLLNTDPYGKGWIMKIKPSNLENDLLNLRHGENVKEWLKAEIEKVEREKKG